MQIKEDSLFVALPSTVMRRQVDLLRYIGDGAPRCGNCRVRDTSFGGIAMADGDYQRHEQECVYALGKKRQPTKESSESVHLENTLEMRPQFDHVGGTENNVLIERLNRAVSLPALTPVSTETHQSLTCDASRTPQGVSSFSNVVDTARALPEDSIWNVDSDRSGNQISTPAIQTDMSNVSDPSAFSWTPFAMDAGWQFGVDDQSLAEPVGALTETCLTSFNELDMSQMYNQQTQSFESTGGSREMIEFLSLGDKVST